MRTVTTTLVLKPLSLYLAHNFNTREKVRGIEIYLEKNYPWLTLINPFYDLERNDVKEIENGERKRWELTRDECTSIVRRDKDAIKRCHGLLAFIEEPSIGTTLEIAFARAEKVDIYIISEEFGEHPWLRVYADHIFETVWEFEQFIRGWQNEQG